MKHRDAYIDAIERGAIDDELRLLYPEVKNEIERYRRLLSSFRNNRETYLISAPGRTELGGNHTDHNNGKILAASIHLDSVGALQKRPDKIVELVSDGYPEPFIADLSMLDPIPEEAGTTTALIRGVACYLHKKGFTTGGMNGFIHSRVLSGSGLSSSASIEVLIAAAFSHMYNGGNISSIDLALAGRFAENVYMGKPCGLMDQLACSTGGIIAVDFNDENAPLIRSVPFNGFGTYVLAVVDTGGSHADLTPEYASIPMEMKETAALFGAKTCRELNADELIDSVKSVREKLGDRHVLRTLHFLEENERVEAMVKHLSEGNIAGYCSSVIESGESSAMYLQNNYAAKKPEEQGIPLALMLSRRHLRNHGGAYRVHGGGFAGTIQAYVPQGQVDSYEKLMESVFGKGCVTKLQIRKYGAYCFD